MGQKVHPYGFRLGVNKPWRSRWFSERDYDKLLVEDVKLRAELREKFPGVSDRIDARRAFMQDVLGIRLKPEVLPLSNIAGALAPYLLAPDRILSKR